MFYVAICDDDNSICSQIENILLSLNKLYPTKIEVEVFNSGEALIQSLSNGMYFDLIFLDIELDKINGIEVGKKLREEMNNETTQIIYISGKDSYAMALFETRPLNFLIKPIKSEKIEDAVKTAMHLLEKSNQLFEFKRGRTITKVPLKEILYFESAGKKINIITTNEVYEFYGKLSDFEDGLSDFIQIHKSYLVNYYHVIEYHYEYVRMSNKAILPISQQRRKLISDRLLQQRQRTKDIL